MTHSVKDIILTPVLNVDTESLVLLPLENPITIEYNKVFNVDGMNDVLGIKNSDYIKLMDLLNVEGRNLVLEKAYFLMRTNKSMGDGNNPMSLFARELMFDRLVSYGCTMKSIMERTVKGQWHWYEQAPFEFLDKALIDADNLNEDQAFNKAIGLIEESPTISYVGSHEVFGQPYLIYFDNQDLSMSKKRTVD